LGVGSSVVQHSFDDLTSLSSVFAHLVNASTHTLKVRVRVAVRVRIRVRVKVKDKVG